MCSAYLDTICDRRFKGWIFKFWHFCGLGWMNLTMGHFIILNWRLQLFRIKLWFAKLKIFSCSYHGSPFVNLWYYIAKFIWLLFSLRKLKIRKLAQITLSSIILLLNLHYCIPIKCQLWLFLLFLLIFLIRI